MDPNAEGILYCPEQIKIPGELPDILKDFTKAAIRTQPPDLLKWSAAYFEALRAGELPLVKKRVEPSLTSPEARLGGLTKGSLAVLHRQFGPRKFVPVNKIREKWENVGCKQSKLEELLAIGHFTSEEVEWMKLLALSCTVLEKTLPEALQIACEIISPDPQGGPARIDLDLFHQLYSFLAEVDGEIPKKQVEEAMQFLTEESKRYNSTVGPRDFMHSLCPRLEGKDS